MLYLIRKCHCGKWQIVIMSGLCKVQTSVKSLLCDPDLRYDVVRGVVSTGSNMVETLM